MLHARSIAIGLAAGLLLGCEASDTGAPDADRAAAASAGVEADAASTAGIPTRTFRFTYEAHLPAPPAGTKRLRLWAPLPLEEAGVQEVRDREILAPAGATATRSAQYGNRFLYAEVAAPTSGVSLKWTAIVTRHEDHGQSRGTVAEADTQENLLIPVQTDAAAIECAEKIRAKLHLDDAALSDAARAKAIYDDVLGDMSYDKSGTGWGRGDFLHAVTVCKGNCTDFHARFIGVGRRAGIPVRFTMGIPMKADAAGSYNSYHCWAHWYDKASNTWKPVDISEADKVVATDPNKAEWFFGHLDCNRIALTYGRDLTLEPAQDGPPLNYMVFPYAEADGQPLALSKDMWTFTYANVE